MLDRPVCLNGCVGTAGAGCVGWYSRYWMSVIFECWLIGNLLVIWLLV